MVIAGRINVTEGGMAHFRKITVQMEMGRARAVLKQKAFTKSERARITFKESTSERGHFRAMLDGKETNFILLEIRL